MTIIFPLAFVALASLALAVLAGIKGASQHTEASQRAGLGVAAVLLTILSLAAGFVSWWAWRFSEEFYF